MDDLETVDVWDNPLDSSYESADGDLDKLIHIVGHQKIPKRTSR